MSSDIAAINERTVAPTLAHGIAHGIAAPPVESASATVVLDPRKVGETRASGEPVVLRNEGGAQSVGQLTCESFSTIAVMVKDAWFSRGEAVEVEYGGTTMAGTIRRANEQPDGKWLVVLQWER